LAKVKFSRLGVAIFLIILYKLWSNRSRGDAEKAGSAKDRLAQFKGQDPRDAKDQKLEDLKNKLAGMEASLGKAGFGARNTGAGETEMQTRKRK
jgi:hypothetical protein